MIPELVGAVLGAALVIALFIALDEILTSERVAPKVRAYLGKR